MPQAGNSSQVPITANKGVTGALFGLAIIAFIIRSYICFRAKMKVHVEDFILLFAVVCLCAATGLAYVTLTAQYAMLQLVLHGFEDDLAFEVLGEIPRISKQENAATTLWWLVIFSVKLAFLFFFRRLISRLRNLNIWWWFAVTLTIVAGFVSMAASWLTCPYFTAEGLLLSCAGLSAEHRTVRDTAITTAMDIMSDLLVLSLPVSLLWKVRISVRQKIGLGLSLCLSCFMVIVTIVRIAGIRLRGSNTVDIVWLAFWQQQECSIAVLMMSVSAFRSLFIQNSAKSPAPRQHKYSPSEKERRVLRRRPLPDLHDDHETNGLPQIPSATLTGITTVIEGDRQSEEIADLDQQPHRNNDRSTETSATDSSARDAELGLSTESVLPHTRSETSNAKQSSSGGTRWWKAFRQPETTHTASTLRTGYWDVMSLFRTGQSESIIQSKDRSEGQL